MCDEYTNVYLLSHNNGLPLIITAIKTSAGKVKEKGLEYYMDTYLKQKPEQTKELLIEAVHKYPSVVEHWVFTFYIDGCSRACTHQLVRHRLASYTQESQRYSIAMALKEIPRDLLEEEKQKVGEEMAPLYAFSRWMDILVKNLKEVVYILEASNTYIDQIIAPLRKLVVFPPTLFGREKAWYAISVAQSLKKYADLLIMGVPYEDGRFVLPSAMRTRIMVTANLREWLHIITLRTSPHAQWEIRCVAERVKEKLMEYVPEEVFG